MGKMAKLSAFLSPEVESVHTDIWVCIRKVKMCMMETLIANHATHDCCLCACAAKRERKNVQIAAFRDVGSEEVSLQYYFRWQ